MIPNKSVYRAETRTWEAIWMRRTTATTDYLKESMGTALLELMQEKPLEKISIEEMTAKADVGRSTYFRYFKSKDEVLSFKILCLWSAFLRSAAETALRVSVPRTFRRCLNSACPSARSLTCSTQAVIRTSSCAFICRAPPPSSRRPTPRRIISSSSSPSGCSG